MLESIAALLIAFGLGSVPTAYILSRLVSGRDIRAVGSGNPGAVNTAQNVGKIAGVAVLLLDAGKGILAVVIAQSMSVTDVWVYGTALSVTLGHNFTPALRFKGGKGAATVLGISAFMLWQITAWSALVGILALVVTRRPVLSVAIVFFALNVFTIATGQPIGQIALCLILSFLVAGTHVWRQYDEIAASVRARDWRGFMRIG